MQTVSRGLLASLLISLMLTACGGGGGGSSDSTPPPEPIPEPEPEPEPIPPPAAVYDLSGTITASASQAVDSDTNDPTRIAIGNNSPATAQAIGNPVTLGGYVNTPGSGESGRSQEEGDTQDYFRLDLLAGQRVTMLVADFEQADADLYLHDIQGEILDYSIDTGNIESLLIEEDGTYLIRAFAFDGATNYILAIGAPGTTGAAAPNYDIVPWQAVVSYADDSGAADTLSSGDEIARSMGLERRAGARGRNRLMALRRGAISAQQMRQRLSGSADTLDLIRDPDLRARWETLYTIKSLRRDPRVRYAEPNYRVRALAIPDDEFYSLQWHYPLIGLPEAWDISTGSANVVVAVIDSGILPNHPDLRDQLVSGYDFVRDADSADDGDGIDPDPTDPGSSLGGSGSFHGTHVSGTIAARGDNRRGGAGTTWYSRVMPLRALGAMGAGTTYDMNQAIRFAAGLANDSGTLPADPVDVINLSLGGAPFSQATQELVNNARAQGVALVAAAGNEASSVPSYPAAYDGVISVSAVDAQRRLALYSNFGAQVDVAAPGGDSSVDINGDGYPDGILSTDADLSDDGISYVYSFLNGTSMAAPHVAGVLALMKSVNPALTPADIDALLAAGELSDDLGSAGRDDQFGHGIINAQRAVLAALEAGGTSPADNPRLVASTNSLNFGGIATELELVLRNGGKGSLELIKLATTESWLAINELSVDDSGLGSYRVSVDRDSLEAGIYTADIEASSTVNSLSVRVLLSVGGTGEDTDVGVIYILLYDPALDETVRETDSNGDGERYTFHFSDVPAGEYEIIAGSDADNDLLICDAGEACGALLTIDQPVRLQVQGDRDDLDFPVEYLVSLPRVAAAQDKPGKSDKTADSAKGIAKRRPSRGK